MIVQFISAHEPGIALAIIVLMLVGFLSERYQPAVVATGAAALFMILGIVAPDDAMKVFSNSAPITVGAMFVLTGALVRTGVLEAVGGFVMKRAGERPTPAIVLMLLATTVASAFMNNTPVVLVLIPVFIRIAKATRTAPTRFLIPLSYAAILGGTCTLIGTSTNLVVDGVARASGLKPFSIFEITPIGLVVVVVGFLTMAVFGRLALPHRIAPGDFDESEEGLYLSDILIGTEKPYAGRALGKIAKFARDGINVLAVRRGREMLRTGLDTLELQKGDVLVVQATDSELLTLSEDDNLRVGGRSSAASREALVSVEALVAPAHGGIGHKIGDLALAQRFGVRVLGVHRHRHIAGSDMESVRLRPADRLLLKGPEEGLASLSSEPDIISLSPPKARAYRRSKAPIALATILGVVVLAAFNVMPIGALALIGVAVSLLLRCMDGDEAWQSIDGSILVLIFAMLVVGAGLEKSGAVQLIVDALQPFAHSLPPVVSLFGLYAVTVVLTELISNNAAAVIVTPLAIALARQIGVDPRPFVVAVMFAASASFATPIGYQTNTLVYGAANYRFSDFLKMGIPMCLIVGAATSAAIYFFMGL